MESLSPLTLLLLFLSGLVLVGWIFLLRIQSLLREKREDGSLQLMQQQIDQLRVQISQARDNGTWQVQQHLGHAQSSYQSADKRIEQFGQKLLSAEIAPGDPATIPALECETG